MAALIKPTLGVALAGALALLLTACIGSAATPVSSVRIDTSATSGPLPSGFLGLALEYNTVPKWVGNASSAADVDPVLVGLMHGLNPGGRTVIRIGGQSTDRGWWPVPGMAQSPGVTYSLTPAWARDARSLMQALDGQLIPSINLEQNSLAVSKEEADQIYQRVGARYIEAMEIGNEPSRYIIQPWYHLLNGKPIPWFRQNVGTPVFARRPGYDEKDFIAEFLRTAAVLPKGVQLAGPDATSFSWLPQFETLIPKTHRIRVLDIHDYPLANCFTNPAAPGYPSIPHMLARTSWSTLLDGGALPAMRYANRAGVQFRIDEMGSVTCDGKAGVSNTFATALWMTNALMFLAHEGVGGVNLHSYPDSLNGLFDLTQTSHGWRGVIHPLYDGALMFARADPFGARQLRVTGDTPPVVQTWATLAPDGHLRVLIVNTGGPRRVHIQVPAGFGGVGSIQRLRAPKVSATGGVTLGGRPASATTTGSIAAPVARSASPDRGGGYTVTAPQDSETLLTLSRS